MAEKSGPKATEAEEQRCAVGYDGKKTMPAVSKEFVKQAKAYSQLHKYCRDNYGDEFVAYAHQASGIMLRKGTVDLPFEVGSRAICCKALPTGMTRIEFFKTIEQANNKARPIHLQEASFLEERLLRIRDSFSLCTKEGGCYRVTDNQARTLLRGMQMLEIVTSNHIAHINACLSSEIFDPLSGCMNLTALQSYLSRNRDMINRIFDAMEKILYRIEKNNAIAQLHGKPEPVSAKIAKRLKNAGQNLQRIAAFIWKHKFTIAVGIVFTVGAAPYVGPALQAAGAAFSTAGTDAGTSVLVRQFTHKICMLASSPRVMGLVISATMYAIANSNWFVSVLGATLSGAAFASLIGTTIATGGVAGFFGASLIVYMKKHAITWEMVIKKLFQNNVVTAGTIVVPQLIMQYVGFILSITMKGLCTINDVATTTTGLVESATNKVWYAAQWIAEKTIGATAPITLQAVGAEKVAGATLTFLGDILAGIENNTVMFGDGMQKVIALLDLSKPLSAMGVFLAPLLTYVLSNKNAELEEVNRMRNYNYELQDFLVNETLMAQTTNEALQKELTNQESSLSSLDQGRLSNNAVVSTLTDQLEVMAKTITPAQFVVTVKPGNVTAPQAPAAVKATDLPTLNVPKDSVDDLQDTLSSFAEIDKVIAKTTEAKKVLEQGKKEFGEAANKADTPLEAKFYDAEIEKIIEMQNDLTNTFDSPSVQTTIISEPHPPTEPHPSETQPLKVTVVDVPKPMSMMLTAQEKGQAKTATLHAALPPPPLPPPQVLARAQNEGVVATKAPVALPPPPPMVLTPVALSSNDMKRVQQQSGASALLLNSQGQIETVIDEKTGEFQQVSPALPPPPGAPLLPTANVSSSLAAAISKGQAQLKKFDRDALKKSLDEAKKQTPPTQTTPVDLADVLSAAFSKKFKNIKQQQTKAVAATGDDW